MDASVASRFVTHFQLETVADLASLWTEEDYTARSTQALDDLGVHQPVQLARLRNAWRLASSEFSQAVLKRRTETPALPKEEPVDQQLLQKLLDDFANSYRFLYTADSIPPPSLLLKLHRELHQKQLAVYCLQELLQQLNAPPAVVGKRQRVSTPLHANDPSRHLLWLLRAIRVLMNAFCIAGNFPISSHTAPGTTVSCCEVTHCAGYVEWVHMQLLLHPGPPEAAAEWLRLCDAATRNYSTELFATGDWPFAEALQEAQRKLFSSLWALPARESATSSAAQEHSDAATASPRPPTPALLHSVMESQGPPGLQAPPGLGERPPRRPAQQPTSICPDFQMGRCVPRQRHCPHEARRVCSRCGRWQHGAQFCTNRHADQRGGAR